MELRQREAALPSYLVLALGTGGPQETMAAGR